MKISPTTSCLTAAPPRLTQRAFSAYGCSVRANTAIGFKGEYQEPFTDQYLLGNGYRSYSPGLMRFTCPDRESPFETGGLNCYAFALNDPINGSDPTGKAPEFGTLLGRTLSQKAYRGRVFVEFDGVVAFMEQQPNGYRPSTLYISAHGAPGSVIGSSKDGYNAARLYRQLDRDIDMSGRPTHFLSCHSSAPAPQSGTSLIEDMSKLTGAASSGYATRVSVTRARNGDEFIAYKHFKLLPRFTSTKVTIGTIRDPK
ncbi:TPA: RHS repeat-associated core domain-containing protein [Pseudomonas putida]